MSTTWSRSRTAGRMTTPTFAPCATDATVGRRGQSRGGAGSREKNEERKGPRAKSLERSLFPAEWKLHKIKLLMVCRLCGCPVPKGRLQCDSCNRSKWLKYKRERNKSCSHRKRCRKFGVPWDPKVRRRAVFKRDGYRCGICGKQTLKDGKMEGNKVHPSSPSVDHIIPLSHGIKGHTWDNVQCACWICNTRKSTRIYGAQMRLF
jgi:5-methylcytosine-specific restriction endonuclease McrA